MTILIVEDEAATARKLQRLLHQLDSTISLVGVLGSVEESVAWLQNNPAPELILMDIELADGQSFEIFNRVDVRSPVIFTTAYDEYALKAFKVNSIDYLLKPIVEADLRWALDKLKGLKNALTPSPDDWQASLANLLKQLSPRSAAPVARPERSRFLVKQGQRLFSVPTAEINYFFTKSKIVFLKTRDGQEWMIDYTMDELETMLDTRRFFRLNRQVIAELRAIEKVNLFFNGKLKLSLLPTFSEEVLVSRERAGDFKRWLGE